MYVSLSFKFHSPEEVERFLKFLERHLRTSYIVNTRLTHVYIQLEGEGKELEEAVALVKNLAALARGGKSRLRVPLLVLFKDAELTRPIPPEVLADALNLKGVPSEVRGGVLETSASYEEVLKAAEELSRIYAEVEKYPITPHAKRIVVAYTYAKGLSVDKAVEELVELGLLNKGSVISLRYSIEETRRRLKFINLHK